MAEGESQGRRIGDIGEEAGRIQDPGKGALQGGNISRISCYSEVLGTGNSSEASYFAIRRSLVNQPNLCPEFSIFPNSQSGGQREQGFDNYFPSSAYELLTLWIVFLPGFYPRLASPSILQRLGQWFPVVTNLTLHLQQNVSCWSCLRPLSL